VPQVVDRPTQGHRFLSRQYVQPQWVLDAANWRVLPDAGRYAPGVKPPPHLSPFVNDDDEGYVPDYAAELRRLQVRALRQTHLTDIKQSSDAKPVNT
jgi:pescadillo protein